MSHSTAPAPRVRRRRWPGLCAVCRAWQHQALCDDCVHRFAAPRPRCLRCALPLPGQAATCGACLREPPPFARCIAAADYGFPWDRLITGLKFHQGIEHAPVLADMLAAAAGRELAAAQAAAPELLLPVPLWPARLRERGHNQAWELARRVAARHGLSARADVLARLRDTTQQMSLPRAQRFANLRDAFSVTPCGHGRVAGRRVALVDDVMTTGATAAEATHALLQAGAREVQVWVMARTVPD